MSDELKRQRGVIEMLCAEIGEPFDRRLECPEMLLAFVRELVAEVADMMAITTAIARVTGSAVSEPAGAALAVAELMVAATTVEDAISLAVQVHDVCHAVGDDQVDRPVEMLSACASAVRFGLEAPCRSRHAADAAQQVWTVKYGVTLSDDQSPGWGDQWARRLFRRALATSAIAAWNRRAPSADHVPDTGKMVAPGSVKDCLTTQAAYRAGAAEMRERAAEQVDCGCSWRADALAATNKGERFVACGNDPCGAIEARAIRALPLPAGGSGWRPIETAPRDQWLYVWNAQHRWLRIGKRFSGAGPRWYFSAQASGAAQYTGGDEAPTHWQPLPATPEEGG